LPFIKKKEYWGNDAVSKSQAVEFMKTNLNLWHFSKCHEGTKMNSPAITAEYNLYYSKMTSKFSSAKENTGE